ncbi:polysaccharide deacetylase family protein [Bythopirellula polymerisocia]|uniref:Polysaccharide deacetylase n=1 Tax=Bythopirellula polymerisocia TaxID=2528003 RepID=A0A5C6CUX0_9BACT|nr:polysaccharide deacetylase family protein [Bythopirellula polymerisocia]TWU27297.1 Polysaccharide deacetylase [Bythopirellula polymerisocia]
MLDTCRSQMLGIYYLATLPQRKHSANERQTNGQVPIISLMYHRVADQNPNAWTISWDRFRAQMDWLAERFELVSLDEAQRRIAADENTRPTACITFDDGYAENCDKAMPWLIERDIPVTYFVTSQNIITGDPFPHDVELGCPLTPNTLDQIREMAEQGIDIGAHSRTHTDFGKIESAEDLYDELVGAKHELESLVEKPIRYFAFPFGMPENMTPEAFEIAFQAGYWGVCSAYGGYNLPGDDSFHIQRINSDPQWTRFLNWLTVDPRKLSRDRPFWPGNYRDRF